MKLRKLGVKGQGAAIGVVILAIVAILGMVIIAKVIESVPTIADETINASLWSMIYDITSNYSLIGLVILAVIVSLILSSLLMIRRG
jgi:hypothetical protein